MQKPWRLSVTMRLMPIRSLSVKGSPIWPVLFFGLSIKRIFQPLWRECRLRSEDATVGSQRGGFFLWCCCCSFRRWRFIFLCRDCRFAARSRLGPDRSSSDSSRVAGRPPRVDSHDGDVRCNVVDIAGMGDFARSRMCTDLWPTLPRSQLSRPRQRPITFSTLLSALSGSC